MQRRFRHVGTQGGFRDRRDGVLKSMTKFTYNMKKTVHGYATKNYENMVLPQLALCDTV